MDKNTLVKVANRNSSRVGYNIEELAVRRYFNARETKEIPFEELERLLYIPGGERMIKDYLIIKDEEAIAALGLEVEPEYFYTEEDVKNILEKGTLNEFLDCLDFAPDGVLDTIKEMAVNLPLNDMSKRQAILEKLDFNVTNAIEIQNTKYDGEVAESAGMEEKPKRRTQVKSSTTGRRSAVPKYKVVSKEE